MPDVWFAIPGELNTLTGGYIYARRLMEALPAAGWTPRHLPLPGGFPHPTAADLAETRAVFAALPKDAVALVDGLAFGTLPRPALDGLSLKFVALVHHPLALETGTPPDRAAHLHATERAALALAKSVVVTSPHTATVLARDYGVSQEHLYIAVPGTDPASRARGGDEEPTLLTVATLTPRKGHDVLIEALAQLTDMPWTNVCVGSLTRDPHMADAVRALVRRYKLDRRVGFAGELNGAALAAAYDNADVFVLPSRYEGYGMVFADALARGLPIVACAAGAVADTVPSDAGILVPPDDPVALSAALRLVLTDAALRKSLADAAWSHGQRLSRWSDTAEKVAAALGA